MTVRPKPQRKPVSRNFSDNKLSLRPSKRSSRRNGLLERLNAKRLLRIVNASLRRKGDLLKRPARRERPSWRLRQLSLVRRPKNVQPRPRRKLKRLRLPKQSMRSSAL